MQLKRSRYGSFFIGFEMDDDGNRLCKACGACCNGFLFDQLKLNGVKEIKPLQARNIGLSVRKGGHILSQPCGAYNSECTIYGERPRGCRNKCALLIELETGQAGTA